MVYSFSRAVIIDNYKFRWLETIDIYYVIVLKTRSPKSWDRQAHGLFPASRGGSLLAST